MEESLFFKLSIAAPIVGFLAFASLVVFLTLLILRLLKKTKRFPMISLSFTLILVLCVIIFYYNQYNNLNFLPKGVYNNSVSSPDDRYEVRTYHYESIFAKMARAELVDKKTNKVETIYFNYYDYSPRVEWENNNIVIIGNEKLDISKNEKYDYRDYKQRSSTLPPQS